MKSVCCVGYLNFLDNLQMSKQDLCSLFKCIADPDTVSFCYTYRVYQGFLEEFSRIFQEIFIVSPKQQKTTYASINFKTIKVSREKIYT